MIQTSIPPRFPKSSGRSGFFFEKSGLWNLEAFLLGVQSDMIDMFLKALLHFY